MLAVAGLAVAGLVNVIQHGTRGAEVPKALAADGKQADDSSASTARADPARSHPGPLPAFVRLPGELRREGGVLWWSTPECAIGWLDVARSTSHELPDEHCRIWPSPDGARTLAVTSRRSDALDGRGLVMATRTAATAEVLSHTRGHIAGEPAWSPDGSAFAVCVRTQHGPVVDLVDWAGLRTIAGACQASWTGGGRLVLTVASPPRVVIGDRTVLSPAQAEQLLPQARPGARRVVSAVGAAGGRIVVAIVMTRPQDALPLASAIAVVSAGGEVVFTASLGRRLPAMVGLASDGSALWYLDAAEGSAKLVAIPGGRRLPPFDAWRLAWSPDGRYLAAGTDQGVVVTRWPGGTRVATVPVFVNDLSWTRAG